MQRKYQSNYGRWTGYPVCRPAFLFCLSSAILFSTLFSLRLTLDDPAYRLPGPHHTVRLRDDYKEHHHSQMSGQATPELQLGTAEAQQQGQSQLQQYKQLSQVSDVPGFVGPPYVLPKIIHQAVKDKHNLSCEVQESIQSWIHMNPGYTHTLYDNNEQRDFVAVHYPELLPIFDALPFDVERTDTWRYLALHKLGGVYADSDIKCLEPISSWNKEHGFDAALIVGIAKRNMRTGDTHEFNQFVIAAMPGHPVLATIPYVIAGNLAYTLLKGLPVQGEGRLVDEGTLMRTGPKAFTSALEAYAHRVGAKWPINSTQADLQAGVLFGSVRAMPKYVLGMGWDTLDHNMTCAEVKQNIRPEALICHQFFASWKSKPEKQLQSHVFTYGDCKKNPNSAGAQA